MELKSVFLTAAAIASVAPPVTSFAQDKPGVTGLEEVVVTARRREERLQDVPISISALDAPAMEQLKIERPEDLQGQVSSFMVQGASKDQMQMGLRGQFVNDTLGTTDAPVNVYFNEALVSRPMGTNQSMYDLAQVQVLKGVQGTLFGRNSTGGALILKPATPGDQFEASVRGTYGNYNHMELQGMVNVPLGDTLAVRVAAKTFSRDGFAKNISTGQELEDKDLDSWRVSLLWRPTEAIDSLTIYDHFKQDASSQNAFTLHAVNPSAPAIAGYNRLALASLSPALQALFPTLAGAFPGTMQALLAEQQRRDNPMNMRSEIGQGRPNEDFLGEFGSQAENWGVQNVTSVAFDGFTLKNIAAYREMDVSGVNDLDGSDAGLIASFQGGAYDLFSEELQALGTALDGKLDWVAGLYYMNEKGDDFGDSNQFNALTVEGTRLGTFQALFNGTNLSAALAAANAAAAAASKKGITSGDVENTSMAAYTGLTYRFNDTWTLAGGLRYTEDERTYVATSRTEFVNTGVVRCDFLVEQSNGTFAPLPIDQCDPEASKTFSKLTYDGTLTYNFSTDAMMYGAYRRGYRSGGFNGRARSFEALVPYDPEQVDEFEVGFKSDFELGDAPARLNGAVFYQDYADIQRQTAVNLGSNTIATVIQNAASGSIYGGELEFEVRPADFISLSMFYSYVDGKYDEYVDPGTGADLSDEWLVFAPKTMLGATLNLYTPMGQLGELAWTLNTSIQSSQHLDDRDTALDQEGYQLINASVNWAQIAGTNLELRLWGRNLTDQKYKVGGVGILDVAGFSSALWGAPRTYGIDLTYRFGK